MPQVVHLVQLERLLRQLDHRVNAFFRRVARVRGAAFHADGVGGDAFTPRFQRFFRRGRLHHQHQPTLRRNRLDNRRGIGAAGLFVAGHEYPDRAVGQFAAFDQSPDAPQGDGDAALHVNCAGAEQPSLVVNADGALGQCPYRPDGINVNEEHHRLAGRILVPLRQQTVAGSLLWETLDGCAEFAEFGFHECAEFVHVFFAAGGRFVADQRGQEVNHRLALALKIGEQFRHVHSLNER